MIAPFGIFAYVPSGKVLTFDDVRVGFVGGAGQMYKDTRELIDQAVVDQLVRDRPRLDLLATFDAPYGASKGYYGQVQGARQVSELIDALRPRWHVSSHYHHRRPPKNYGTTLAFGLNSLVAHPRAAVPHVMPDGFAILDTCRDSLEWVDADRWTMSIPKRDFDFVRFVSGWRAGA